MDSKNMISQTINESIRGKHIGSEIRIDQIGLCIESIGDIEQNAIYQLKIKQRCDLRDILDVLDEIQQF